MLEFACIADLKTIVALSTWGGAAALTATIAAISYKVATADGADSRARLRAIRLTSQRA